AAVSAEKIVDFPTFGSPTIPQFNAIASVPSCFFPGDCARSGKPLCHAPAVCPALPAPLAAGSSAPLAVHSLQVRRPAVVLEPAYLCFHGGVHSCPVLGDLAGELLIGCGEDAGGEQPGVAGTVDSHSCN